MLDQNLNVVARVSSYVSLGALSSFTLSQSTFIPETHLNLGVTDSLGQASLWNGKGLDGLSALPNGYYRMRLVQTGLPPIDQHFWIEHGDWNGGSVAVLGSPAKAGQDPSLHYGFQEAVYFNARVYNLAGELVSQSSEVGVQGNIQLKLRTPSGQPVSSGIYLVEVRALTVLGGLEFIKYLKVAVVR